MKVWISKYALTSGIKETDARESSLNNGYVYPKGGFIGLKLGRDAHESLEEAQAAAEKMRKKRIASLEKQVEKLKAMKF